MIDHQQHFSNIISGFSYRDYPAFQEWPSPQSAGILIPILAQGDWTIFLTQRTHKLRDHGGEICFPGGKREDNETLEESALRETKEELGVTATQTLGRISSVPLFTSNYRLVPFVAFIDDYPSQINTAEVEILIPLSINNLCALPSVDGIPFHYQGKEYLSPIFDLQGLIPKPPTIPIFGGTAIVLYEVLELLCKAFAKPPPPIIRSQRSWPLM